MNPLVSVVIPTYNRKELVLAAIRSVLRQSYRPLEIIVADDCSTDGTAEAVLSLEWGMPVRVTCLHRNSGPAAARNAGVQIASGRYIAFLDSDDAWVPSKIEQQVEAFAPGPEGERQVVYSPVWIRRRRETVVRPPRAISAGEAMADYLFVAGGHIAQSTVLLPAALAREVPYDERLRVHEDWDLFMRLQAQGASFIMVPQPLAVYADDTASGRASEGQALRSLATIEQWKHRISRQAYLALRAKVAPDLRGSDALRASRFIAEAIAARAISPVYSLALFGRLLHPGLRELGYAARGRLRMGGARRGSGD